MPLFDRVHRRLRLNAYGRILLEHARRSISEIHTATERIAELRDPDTGTVRLAFLHSQAGWFVPDLLRRFRTEAPLVRFELFQGAAHQIVERLANGGADLAITSPRPEGFRWRGMYMERLCLAVPRDHRFARRSRIRLADAGAEPFVALAPDFGLRQLTADIVGRGRDLTAGGVRGHGDPDHGRGWWRRGFGVAVVPVPRPERAEPGAAYIRCPESSARRQDRPDLERGPPIAARCGAPGRVRHAQCA